MSTLSIKNEYTDIDCQTVLAVDDQPICLDILEKLIETQGVSVDTAKDGQEALSLWKAKKYPLIVTDCQMPNMDGYELAKAIRAIEQKENINNTTIIALTANSSNEEESRCVEAGIDEMVTKPVDNAQIETLFSNWWNIAFKNQVVDFSILAQIFPDNRKQFNILAGFQTHIEEDYLALQNYAQQNNLPGVESIAHRMKGSSIMVGVNGIANICGKIEKEAKDGTIADDDTLSTLNQNIRVFAGYMAQQARFNAANIDQGELKNVSV